MSARNAKILIVDDEGSVRALLAAVVKAEGFIFLEARDGEKALELVKSESPDLMLLDIRLPDINGMEVLRLAKEIDPDLSVIVLTGYSDTTGAVSAMKAGAFDYLCKPFELKDLVKAIHQALDERRRRLEIKEYGVQKRD